MPTPVAAFGLLCAFVLPSTQKFGGMGYSTESPMESAPSRILVRSAVPTLQAPGSAIDLIYAALNQQVSSLVVDAPTATALDPVIEELRQAHKELSDYPYVQN